MEKKRLLRKIKLIKKNIVSDAVKGGAPIIYFTDIRHFLFYFEKLFWRLFKINGYYQ